MNLSFGERVKLNKEGYKEEISEELKNNSIVLSFAISIIIVGIFSIFYNNNNSLLIGIAISSLLLTLIQCFSNGNTMLNILPVFTLLLFGFFQKSIESIPVVNLLLKDDYTNFIIFISFSLTFLTQAYKNIIYKHSLNQSILQYNDEKNKMILDELDVIKNIKEKTIEIKNIVSEKNIDRDALDEKIDSLLKYVENETFVSNVKSTLINKGNEDNKVTFNIDEVEESIMLNSGLVRNREINAGKIENSFYE